MNRVSTSFSNLESAMMSSPRPSRSHVIGVVDGASGEVSAAKGETQDPTLRAKLDSMAGDLSRLRSVAQTASASNPAAAMGAVNAVEAAGRTVKAYCAG